jgi:glycosyltransferase involved in cell wall biosynthesis
MRFLVAWFVFSLNGGIGRFIHLARALEGWGHTVDFLSVVDQTQTPWPALQGRILTLEETTARAWDAVMVPGAGAAPELIPFLALLRERRFGHRVQHVLNDPRQMERFLSVNWALRPHTVVINNRHWPPRLYSRLKANAHHILCGGVDLDLHYPLPVQPMPRSGSCWNLGGIASKNLAPLLEAMDRLPDAFRLNLFGPVRKEDEAGILRLRSKGRLRYYGLLMDEDLARFYRNLDLVVTTEEHAGWCNTAAEAFANGVPGVVTRAGTLEFARHGENAFVLDSPDPKSIAHSVRALTGDKNLLRRFSENAARVMRSYSWTRYAQKMLALLEPAGELGERGISMP